jgi:hypothetical protein
MLLTPFRIKDCLGLANLEPSEPGLMIGAWYDRLNQDTPVKIMDRVQTKPFSIWQSDMNITDTLQSSFIDDFVLQVNASNSNAYLYLTLYPIMGFEAVTVGAINEFAEKIKTITATGRKVMIRYASEMNGNWFRYGQQPAAFLASWKQVVDAVRGAVEDRSMIAFLWAPNSGNGYPFEAGVAPGLRTSPDFALLDTNRDGNFTIADDPYTPYFPGDDYVDWVGFSVIDRLI